MTNREQILQWLQNENVAYRIVEHPPAYDMQDVADYGINKNGEVAKNLFMRDSRKGRRHILMTVKGDEQVDLQKFSALVGERLSFASEQRLEKYLNVHKGEVSPLDLLFDSEHEVELFFDSRLGNYEAIGVHPGDNRATVFVAMKDMVRLVEKLGNKVTVLDF